MTTGHHFSHALGYYGDTGLSFLRHLKYLMVKINSSTTKLELFMILPARQAPLLQHAQFPVCGAGMEQKANR